MAIVDESALSAAASTFSGAWPFDHCVVDGFFTREIAHALAGEFPDSEDSCWLVYENALEVKRACNDWRCFGRNTTQAFNYLNSAGFLRVLKRVFGVFELFADPSLHGGGWHLHGRGGRLNPHLDYNLHPVLGLQRKLNIIVYLNRGWASAWGGQFGLWSQALEGRGPGALAKRVEPLFNRAIIFDTTQESWHGLAEPVSGPPGFCRRSIGAYYPAPAPEVTEQRFKALFAPVGDQVDDVAVQELIANRACLNRAASVWRSPPGSVGPAATPPPWPGSHRA